MKNFIKYYVIWIFLGLVSCNSLRDDVPGISHIFYVENQLDSDIKLVCDFQEVEPNFSDEPSELKEIEKIISSGEIFFIGRVWKNDYSDSEPFIRLEQNEFENAFIELRVYRIGSDGSEINISSNYNSSELDSWLSADRISSLGVNVVDYTLKID